MESINGSLERLGTEYVDVYQAHRYDYETPLEETMEAFADVVHSGRAHYIGVSEWRAGGSRAGPPPPPGVRGPPGSHQPPHKKLLRGLRPGGGAAPGGAGEGEGGVLPPPPG